MAAKRRKTGAAESLDSASVSQRILNEAAHLFFHQGYGSSSIRDLAAAVGISSSTLYHHYGNKAAILAAVLERFMRDFNEALLPILKDSARTHEERVRDTIVEHIVFSQRRHTELLVGQPFRYVLGKRPLARVVAMQREYRDAMADVLEEGVKAGVFAVSDVKTTTMLLLDAANGLREWYRADAGRPIEALAATYGEIAVRACEGAAPAASRARRPVARRR